MPEPSEDQTKRQKAVTDTTSSARLAPPVETTPEVLLELVKTLKDMGASDEVIRAAELEVQRLLRERLQPA